MTQKRTEGQLEKTHSASRVRTRIKTAEVLNFLYYRTRLACLAKCKLNGGCGAATFEAGVCQMSPGTGMVENTPGVVVMVEKTIPVGKRCFKQVKSNVHLSMWS